MRSRISLACAAAVFAAASGIASGYSPSVSELDAEARAAGNQREIAQRIGDAVFATRWAAEVTQISANALAGHLIVGIRVLGVKFHRPMTRDEFAAEMVDLVEAAFVAEPSAEEIDVWASVPISVGKGVIVSGDLAKPTSRTVFSLSVRRGESVDSLRVRVRAGTNGVFWDDEWTKTAFRGSV